MIPRKVEVVPYRKEWVKMFQDEAQKIVQILEAESINIHHIGSTSIQGLSAKPIIDLLAEANEIEMFDRLIPEFKKLGYIANGENGIQGRRYFVKVNEQGEHLIHMHGFQKGNSEIYRHLVFRDFLRNHPHEIERYANVKEIAAQKFPFDIDAYMDYKDPIIKEIEKKALNWDKKKEGSH